MSNDTRNKIITANNVLTLKKARELQGKSVAICCKNETTGNFNEYVDRHFIKEVSKIIGSKGHVITDIYGTWSYHCLDGKNITQPDFQTGDELTVYFIEL